MQPTDTVSQDWLDQARRDPQRFDDLAEHLGIDLHAPGWGRAAHDAIGFWRPPGPAKYASPRCKSGRRNYCSCNICY